SSRQLIKLKFQTTPNLTYYNGLPMYIQFIKKLFFPYGYEYPPLAYQLAPGHIYNGFNQDDNRLTIDKLNQSYFNSFNSTEPTKFFNMRTNKDKDENSPKEEEPIKVQIMNKNGKWFNYIFWIAMLVMMFFLFNTI